LLEDDEDDEDEDDEDDEEDDEDDEDDEDNEDDDEDDDEEDDAEDEEEDDEEDDDEDDDDCLASAIFVGEKKIPDWTALVLASVKQSKLISSPTPLHFVFSTRKNKKWP